MDDNCDHCHKPITGDAWSGPSFNLWPHPIADTSTHLLLHLNCKWKIDRALAGNTR